jgi:urease accessory protein
MKDEESQHADSSFILHPSSFRRRITASQFVTPPEFRGLRLSASEAGRVGGVRIELIGGGTRTALGLCYQQVPLRVLPPFPLPGGGPALLYLLNPTAGLLDGDGQLIEVTARAGTRTLVVGQSATRVHPCLNGFATQQWVIRVEAGASLVVLPGPAIPFAGCRYYQRVEARVQPGATFVWGDVGYAGRYARGTTSERFRFDAWVQEMTVFRADRLAFRDRCCWRGPWDDRQAVWHCGTGTAWGTVFATGPDVPTQHDAPRNGGACFTTAAGDTCVRWIGAAEAVTTSVVRAALHGATSRTMGDVDPFGEGLAPVHWFSGGAWHGDGARSGS